MDRGRLGKTVAAPAYCNLSFQTVGFDIHTSGGWSTLVRQVERIPLHWSSGRKNKRRPSGWHNVSLQDAPSHTTPLRCNHQHGLQLQHLTRCAFEWENTYNTLILPSSARGRRTERYTGSRGATGKTSNVSKLQNSSATSATSSKNYSIAGRTLTSREQRSSVNSRRSVNEFPTERKPGGTSSFIQSWRGQLHNGLNCDSTLPARLVAGNTERTKKSS
ncbi:hypothetical protein CCHR01_15604 [Colletotrichum chrysophilum]|uniref:Uncharacterized protein n=1 Tax=Colletotrichum chrysophilum TaxID=1836956 RepID=A0AAD9A5F0_9PEZI|nr:hypothetical protein CCHR01_15604 [Colletotrichum chrysophilum]